MTQQDELKLKTALAIFSGRRKPVISNPHDLGLLLKDLGLNDQEIYDTVKSASTMDPFLEMAENIVLEHLK